MATHKDWLIVLALLAGFFYFGINQAKAQTSTSDQFMPDLRWHRSFDGAMAAADTFAVYNLNLFAAFNGLEAPELYRFPLGGDPLSAQPEPIAIDGIPNHFLVQAIGINTFTEHILAAGKVASSPTIYRAKVTPKGEIGTWEKLVYRTEIIELDFTRVLQSGPYSIFCGDLLQLGYPQFKAIAANMGYPADELDWIDVPELPKPRIGFAPLMTSSHLLVVGGQYLDTSTGEGGSAASYCEGVLFEAPNFEEWKVMANPVSVQYQNVVGAQYGSGLFITPKSPVAVSGEEPTSQTLTFCTDKTGGFFSLWEEAVLAQPAGEIRAMLVEPGLGQLLLFADSMPVGSLECYAYDLPKGLYMPPLSAEDVELMHLEKSAPRVNERSLEDTLSEARDNGQYALIVLGDEDRKTDLYMRVQMGGSKFRYMAQNTEMTYLRGEAAREAASRYGVGALPAYLLIDELGNVVRRHEGSRASAADVFQLTSPTRQPRTPTPAPTPTAEQE